MYLEHYGVLGARPSTLGVGGEQLALVRGWTSSPVPASAQHLFDSRLSMKRVGDYLEHRRVSATEMTVPWTSMRFAESRIFVRVRTKVRRSGGARPPREVPMQLPPAEPHTSATGLDTAT